MNILTRYSDTVAIGDNSDEIHCPSTRQLMLPLAVGLWPASMMTLLRFFTPSPDRAQRCVLSDTGVVTVLVCVYYRTMHSFLVCPYSGLTQGQLTL